MKIIQVIQRNREVEFVSDYPEDEIKPFFSFRPQGYQFMPKYRWGQWDGWIYLLKRDRVPSGLFRAMMPKIEAELGIRFEIQFELFRLNYLPQEVPEARPMQVECVEAMKKASQEGGGLVIAATGIGKTFLSGLYFKMFTGVGVFVVDELTLLYQAKAELEGVLKEEVGVVGDSEYTPRRITVATIQTLGKHRKQKQIQEWFERIEVIIYDEFHCFPGNVEVLTETGYISIEEIVKNKMKVKVLSRAISGELEWQSISNWLCKAYNNKLLKIHHEHGTLVCTPDHPIWVDGVGYKLASQIKIGDSFETANFSMCTLPAIIHTEANQATTNEKVLFSTMFRESKTKKYCTDLRMVWQKIYRKTLSSKPSKILFTFVRSMLGTYTTKSKVSCQEKYQQMSSGCKEQSTFEKTHCKKGFRTNETSQSNVYKKVFGKSQEIKEQKRLQLVSEDSWWKWKTIARITKIISNCFETSNGICFENIACESEVYKSSQSLQVGYSRRKEQDSYRSRWMESQTFKQTKARQAERESTELSRVESIEIVQPRNQTESECVSEKSSFVYCLEVENNHNFFADGVLVSNCSMARRNFAVMDTIAPMAVFGLTATLELQKRDIAVRAYAIAGPVIFKYGLEEGKQAGYLSQGVVIAVELDKSIYSNAPKDYQEDYRTNILHNHYRNKIIKEIVETAHKDGRHIVLLTERVEHVKKLSEMVYPIPHRRIYGAVDVEDRQAHKEEFETGDRRLIITNKVFKKGVNIKKIDVIIDCAGQKSKNDAVQKFGRGVRTSEGKLGLVYIDISDTYGRFLRNARSRQSAFKAVGVKIKPWKWVDAKEFKILLEKAFSYLKTLEVKDASKEEKESA